MRKVDKNINSKKIVPIHTEHPENYEKWVENVRRLKVGEKVET